jgi:acetylornithine deacetylase/succinyl-diaminopimelate desuccinylase-like protein
LQTEALALLRDAIAIKSESEIGIYEGDIAAFYVNTMRDFGLSVEQFEAAPGRPSVIGRVEGRGLGRSLMFNSHLYCPSSRLEDWRTPPYEGVVDEGRIYGLGVSDTKAGIVAMLLAAREIARLRPRGSLVVGLGAGGEKGGFLGTKAIVDRGVRADVAIVCEPTDLNVVCVQYGAVWADVTVKGAAGLTGAGVNAIEKGLPVIHALLDLNKIVNERRHPLLPPSKIGVNAVHAGTGNPNVPDRCVITVDRRIVPGETPEAATREIEMILEELRRADPSLDASLAIDISLPPIETAQDSTFVGQLRDALGSVRSQPPEIRGIRGFTEMVHLVRNGIEAVVCGPGSSAVIHAPNEYVPVAEFFDAIGVYTTVARNILDA